MENLPEKQIDSDVQILKSSETSLFSNKEIFEHSQRVAGLLSKSALVPKDYQNNIANCVIALEISSRIGASPLMVMQNLYIVHGKPSWSSKFLIATLNACGKFSPLRYEEDEEEGGRARAYATDKATGETLYGIWVTMKMAEAEGWISKNGSKWKTMPQLMRRYRAASFFTNQFAPELSMGIMTYDEVVDVQPIESRQKQQNKEAERVAFMIQDSKTVDELKNIEPHVSPEQMDLFSEKMEQLKGGNK